eukprot:2147948-Alexandrium_andersonii.AAC.1
MLVWPEEEEEEKEDCHMREIRLRQEARNIRRKRQIAAKQALLCKVQQQSQTIDSLQQELRDWEEWLGSHKKPRTKAWLTVGQQTD